MKNKIAIINSYLTFNKNNSIINFSITINRITKRNYTSTIHSYEPRLLSRVTVFVIINGINKRFYPGGMLSTSNIRKFIGYFYYKSNTVFNSSTSMISMRTINIWYHYKIKQRRDMLLNEPGSIIYVQAPISENKVTTLVKIVDNINILLKPKYDPLKVIPEKLIHSGLLTVPPEYIKKGLLFQKEFNYTIMLIYYKTLFNLGIYKIYNDEALFEHIDKFFLSISELYYNKQYANKWIEKTAAITQHVLRALFLNKKFPKKAFEIYMDHDVDFNQYQQGDILLLIECFISKNTLKDLLKKISFTAINHETNEEQRPGYSKKICQQLTGQENADFHGKRALSFKNGDISLETTHYKDVKTYESGILKGRLAIRYDLYSNAKNVREQITKITTSIQISLTKPNINANTKKYLIILYDNLLKEQEQLFIKLKKTEQDKITETIKNACDHNTIQENFESIYNLIRQAILNPEISSYINLGLSFDPGIDTEFIRFSKNYLQINLEHLFTTKEIIEVLYHNLFNKEAHRQLLKKMITYFPEENQLSIQKAMDYIDNK